MDNNQILELHNHLALNECFKKHLVEDSKPKTYPTVTYRNDRCNCRFYEWSNLNNEPKIFDTGQEFLDFLDKCHVSYTQEQKNDFTRYYNFYATCVQGEARILITHSLDALKTALKNAI